MMSHVQCRALPSSNLTYEVRVLTFVVPLARQHFQLRRRVSLEFPAISSLNAIDIDRQSLESRTRLVDPGTVELHDACNVSSMLLFDRRERQDDHCRTWLFAADHEKV